MNPLSPLLFWLVFFALLWGLRVIAEGRRRWLADRQHPLRALERCVRRAANYLQTRGMQ